VPFERLGDYVVDVPAHIHPMLHNPADLQRHRGLFPGVPHAEIDDRLRISIVHVRPRGAESSHIAQAIHPPADVRAGKRVAVRLLVGQEHYEMRLLKRIDISVDQCAPGFVG